MTRLDPTDLDRLVDGELPPQARRDLIRRVELHPDGWRRLALAFLEAQAFAEASADRPPAPISLPFPRRPRRRLALAASLLGLAFVTGWGLRARLGTDRGVSPMMSRSADPVVPPEPRTMPTPAPVTPPDSVDGPTELASAGETLTPYVKAAWAREGYQIDSRQQTLSINFDGQALAIPVAATRVRFVGRPVD